ncbi:extracellular solute-binding protein [Actinophytocola gossypii]|uniref:Extracellular solute-binding protein n=1 Tax=Actinophytocola gossypii TaxID=2812003 RepID=A0ABT2J3Z7_9PSEU|nr:extracellular solute-binding protein [Actinophytocola gossypii]MCT2582401.1 extracellular solute-binding protein [Actinophytocola gossypii]
MSTLPRRKFLGLVGAGVGAGLVGTTASGCGTDATGGGGDGGEQMQIWVLQEEAQNVAHRVALDSFNSDAEVRGRLVSTSNDGYRDKLHTAMGSADNAPDVFYNWGGGSIRSYARDDLLVDLTPHLEQDQAWKDKFIPSVLDAGMIDGKYYGIPARGMQPIILFYNKAVLADHDLQPPTTWDELLAASDRLSGNGVIPFALAGGDAWCELVWPEYLVDRIGGPEVFRAIAAGEEGAWRHPALIRSMNMITDLVERGGFGDSFASVRWEGGGASTLIAQGQAGMHLMGSWEYTNQVTDQPEYAANDLGFADFPAVDGGVGDPKAIVGNPTNYFSISKSSPNVDAALEFLRTEMASDAYIDAWLKAGDVPATTNLEARMDAAANRDYAELVYNMVVDAPSFQLSWDQAVERHLAQPMLDALAKVFLGQLDAEGFVAANENAAK